MNKIYRLTVAAVIIISGATQAEASTDRLSGAQYVKTQLTLLNGITEMLNIPTIADGPDEVADGIRQLIVYLRCLVAYKEKIPAEELTKAEAAANRNKRTCTIGQAFLDAINKTANNNFYNSNKLAESIRELSEVLLLL